MQTFLPYPDFYETFNCLDRKRLGNQRKETSQILDILDGKFSAWRNHPAVLMWKGYEECLKEYYNINLFMWEKRGYRNIKLQPKPVKNIIYPSWLGGPIHSSHRQVLLFKNDWYQQFEWTESPKYEYFWPCKI
jgi:hypothetical protein